jgi:hypothetical protein
VPGYQRILHGSVTLSIIDANSCGGACFAVIPPEQAEHFASDSGVLALLRVTLQPAATKSRQVSPGSSR